LGVQRGDEEDGRAGAQIVIEKIGKGRPREGSLSPLSAGAASRKGHGEAEDEDEDDTEIY
jgi:hypothetical protein